MDLEELGDDIEQLSIGEKDIIYTSDQKNIGFRIACSP